MVLKMIRENSQLRLSLEIEPSKVELGLLGIPISNPAHGRPRQMAILIEKTCPPVVPNAIITHPPGTKSHLSKSHEKIRLCDHRCSAELTNLKIS